MAKTPAKDPIASADIVPATPTTPAVQQPPSFSVAERRLKHGDLSMLKQAADFELKGFDEPMATYWGETEKAYDLINVYGWVLAKAEHLPMDAKMLGLSVSPEGYVTRGTKGSEMLFIMPKALREEILHSQAETRKNDRMSRRSYQKAMELNANDPNLSPDQRARAQRALNTVRGDKRANYQVLEHTETISGQPIE